MRADLDRRMGALPGSDPRREGMAAVRAIINDAEVDLKAAVTEYGALEKQLDFVIDSGAAAGSQWTPRDAARQAVAATHHANAGVNGLKQAMARFEQVMTQGAPADP